MIKITHVIFDVDGLILDTESIYTEFTSNFLSGYNLQFDYNIKKLMMGRKPHEAGEILVKHYNLPLSADEFIQRQTEYITPERWESVQCLPGAEKLILHLASHNIPMALATGCCSYELDQKMRNHQVIMTKVSHSVCSGDDPTSPGSQANDSQQCQTKLHYGTLADWSESPPRTYQVNSH
ncbi:unnamed protein product [Schistosoma mattheei]|uniref:HAD family hydrolase n=1 Tax=Schistosoma mattheei TaxID=31246 RepID=A0AA85BWL6_9TREM|nr:unnamed protein product [Schistosoma mattheei]